MTAVQILAAMQIIVELGINVETLRSFLRQNGATEGQLAAMADSLAAARARREAERVARKDRDVSGISAQDD